MNGTSPVEHGLRPRSSRPLAGRLRILFGRLAAVAVGLHLLTGGAAAQSLLSLGGLGSPLDPLDARARAMGSVGVGLFGPSLLPGDPGAARALLVPTLTFTMQPTWGTATDGTRSADLQGTRFPLLGIAYPVSPLRGMVTLTFGAFMDQRWALRRTATVSLVDRSVEVQDFFRSDGGISTVQVGWAQQLGDRLVVAAAAGRYTGSVTRTFVRSLDSLAVGADVTPFTDGGRWTYSGLTATVGAVFDPVELLRVSGSLTWSGTLEATPSEETRAPGASYRLPLTLRAGASGALTSRLALSTSLAYSAWPTSPGAGLTSEVVVGGVWDVGVGIEWKGPRVKERDLPLRLGYRRRVLPFRLGPGGPSESILAGGVGLHLAQFEDLALARIDLALERTHRESGAFAEDFWRGSISLHVSGW